jgi:hypothetical protein
VVRRSRIIQKRSVTNRPRRGLNPESALLSGEILAAAHLTLFHIDKPNNCPEISFKSQEMLQKKALAWMSIEA